MSQTVTSHPRTDRMSEKIIGRCSRSFQSACVYIKRKSHKSCGHPPLREWTRAFSRSESSHLLLFTLRVCERSVRARCARTRVFVCVCVCVFVFSIRSINLYTDDSSLDSLFQSPPSLPHAFHCCPLIFSPSFSSSSSSLIANRFMCFPIPKDFSFYS